MQTLLSDHFEEKTDFADHYLEDLEKKYNWHEEVLPYAHLHKRFMFRLAIDERKYVQPVLSEGEFEFRKGPDVVDNFFHHGKPKYLGVNGGIRRVLDYVLLDRREVSLQHQQGNAKIQKKTRPFGMDELVCCVKTLERRRLGSGSPRGRV